jgi:haloalkane dehalogenase
VARLVRELDLQDLTVVVQDWGGPIGFRFAVENPGAKFGEELATA